MLQLKRKKMLEAEVEKYFGALTNLERQIMALESMHMDVEVLSGFKRSAAAMKAVHTQLDVDKVDEVMDDLEDAMDLHQEISTSIGREIGPTVPEVRTAAGVWVSRHVPMRMARLWEHCDCGGPVLLRKLAVFVRFLFLHRQVPLFSAHALLRIPACRISSFNPYIVVLAH